MKKSVLFISHDASRTGAPIVLLNFLKWFKENSDIPFQILLKNGGELEDEFSAIAPVTLFRHYQEIILKRNLITRAVSRVGKIIGLKSDRANQQIHIITQELKKELEQKAGKNPIGLIYCNTITNGEVLEYISNIFQCPIITHVHELEWSIQSFGSLFEKTKKYTQHYIACSAAVASNLNQTHNIENYNITVIHAFVPIDHQHCQQRERDNICKELGIPESSLLVGASGTVDWRKGADLFIQLAKTIYKKNSKVPIHFLWLGHKVQETYFRQLQHDMKRVNLEEYIHFLGSKPNPLDYFAAYDVFTLMSREDPFPLVCLEAASVGTPVVCFDQGGGAKELVEDDCGFVIPYLDLETMAMQVLKLLDSSQLRDQLGQQGQTKVKERYSLDSIAPKLLDFIEYLLNYN